LLEVELGHFGIADGIADGAPEGIADGMPDESGIPGAVGTAVELPQAAARSEIAMTLRIVFFMEMSLQPWWGEQRMALAPFRPS
jgi:hypothetical protein